MGTREIFGKMSPISRHIFLACVVCVGIAFFLCCVEGFEVDDDGFLRVTDDDPLRGFVG